MNKSIQNTDALSFLKQLKDNSVDLILTDPPYGISRETGFKSCINGVDRFKISYDFGEWDHDIPYEYMEQVFNEYYRVLKPHGTCIVFYDLWKITTLKDMLERSKFKQIRLIEWLKTNPVPINSKRNYLTNSREIALSCVKKSKPTFNSSYDNGVYKYPICQDKGRFHPTQKPIKLLKDLILKHSNKNELVLDTFAGSFSCKFACDETNRRFIGCEVSEEYYNKAIEKYHNH